MLSYYALFHSHLPYGIFFWGNSACSEFVFKWQKRAIQGMLGLNLQDSCKEHFRTLQILTEPCITDTRELYRDCIQVPSIFNTLKTA